MRRSILIPLLTLILTLAAPPSASAAGGNWTLIGWNNLGMHCMDSDYSVFSILPPYNTIHAQLIDGSGKLVRNPAGVTVTYEAVRDPAGSINTTSRGKTTFWQFVSALYGASPAPDAGLTGVTMPGTANRPQPMIWEAAQGWFMAEGIPLTPYDDAGHKNAYPMMRLVARDSTGAVLAVTQIVLPVSDEMSCASCHGSGSAAAARPAAGWVNDPNRDRDYRLNVLRLHDDRQAGSAAYTSSLAWAGYKAAGLYATATAGTPILCAKCHASNALPGTGYSGIPPLTASVHGLHSHAVDPGNGMTLEASANRAACYTCHPGSTTRCLRGAMGSSVAADGTLAMQCQSCHGPMSAVGAPARQGWLEEPVCQSCHTGTATQNTGQIRYISAFSAPGQPRQPASDVFATNPNAPVAGVSLYRFSYGHGGLACEACHGSTHAEFPTSHPNDNIQSSMLQGHKGVMAECAACHGAAPVTVNGGPHGMHPVGPAWVQLHGEQGDGGGGQGGDFANKDLVACQGCHGADYRGTVLSASQADWTVNTEFGSFYFWRGYRIGCYTCHNGPGGEGGTPNAPPQVSNASAATRSPAPVTIPLYASDPNGNALALRVVSQPAHGTAGLIGTTATYYPESGYAGTDTFTYAASDGTLESNLGTVTIAVTAGGGGGCTLTCTATVPGTAREAAPVPFGANATATNCGSLPTYAWNFGDNQTSTLQNPVHTYVRSGGYTWSLTVAVAGQTCAKSGQITVAGQPPLVTGVARMVNPFRVRIDGSNFHSNMQVTVAGQAWANVGRQGSTVLVLRSGNALQALFPANTWVPIRLLNPDDGQNVTVQFNRTTNQWRFAARK